MIDVIQSLYHSRELNKHKKTQREKDNYQDIKAVDLLSRINELEQRHEQLKLTTLALWSLLRDHSGLLESDLKKYVEKLDLLDGHRDGKYTENETLECSGCSRKILSKSLSCPYCGSRMNRKSAFSGV